MWFFIVFCFSNQTGYESSKISDKVTRELLKVKDTLSVVIENYEDTNEIIIKGIETNPITNERVDRWELKVRKLAHYFLFTIGGILIILLINSLSIKYKTEISIFLGLLFASIDEIHQFWSQNRGPRLFDVGIDTLGVISGVVLGLITINIFSKIGEKINLLKKINISKKGKKIYDRFQKNHCKKDFRIN